MAQVTIAQAAHQVPKLPLAGGSHRWEQPSTPPRKRPRTIDTASDEEGGGHDSGPQVVFSPGRRLREDGRIHDAASEVCAFLRHQGYTEAEIAGILQGNGARSSAPRVASASSPPRRKKASAEVTIAGEETGSCHLLGRACPPKGRTEDEDFAAELADILEPAPPSPHSFCPAPNNGNSVVTASQASILSQISDSVLAELCSTADELDFDMAADTKQCSVTRSPTATVGVPVPTAPLFPAGRLERTGGDITSSLAATQSMVVASSQSALLSQIPQSVLDEFCAMADDVDDCIRAEASQREAERSQSQPAVPPQRWPGAWPTSSSVPHPGEEAAPAPRPHVPSHGGRQASSGPCEDDSDDDLLLAIHSIEDKLMSQRAERLSCSQRTGVAASEPRPQLNSAPPQGCFGQHRAQVHNLRPAPQGCTAWRT